MKIVASMKIAWYMTTCVVLVTNPPKTSPALPAVAASMSPVKENIVYFMVHPPMTQ